MITKDMGRQRAALTRVRRIAFASRLPASLGAVALSAMSLAVMARIAFLEQQVMRYGYVILGIALMVFFLTLTSAVAAHLRAKSLFEHFSQHEVNDEIPRGEHWQRINKIDTTASTDYTSITQQ